MKITTKTQCTQRYTETNTVFLPFSVRSLWPLCLCGIWLLGAGCKKKVDQVVYQAVPVERRDINVSAIASGTLQPDTTVEAKSSS